MAKTLSFAVLHTGIAFAVGVALTGDPWVGRLLALVEPACNTVAFHLHERLWKRAGQRRAMAPPGPAMLPA